MPTYDYECSGCGEIFELFQKMTDTPIKKCPKCKGKVKRLISSGSGLIFKGKGFYATDYKKNGALPQTNKNGISNQCGGCENSSCPQAQK